MKSKKYKKYNEKQKYEINKLYMIITEKNIDKNLKICQNRFSILVYLNKIYKSKIKEFLPNNLYDSNQYFISSIISVGLNP